MTTPKRNITSHKRPTTKLHPAPGQSFDIIPRSQVRPTVTARPVLTPTKPEQSDNTLQSSTQAASSQLTHGKLNFTSSAPELGDNDAELLLDKVASISAEMDKPKVKHTAAVVEDEDHGQDEAQDEAEDEAQDDVEPEPATDPLKDQDVALDKAPDTEASAAPDESDASPGSAEPADGSIDHIFKDDPQQSIEHSQALKDELQNIDDKPEEAVHPHHELYGGKPVIVIHKAHSAQATLNWILWFIFCLLLALVIVDVLLDSGTITTDYNIPHTTWLQ